MCIFWCLLKLSFWLLLLMFLILLSIMLWDLSGFIKVRLHACTLLYLWYSFKICPYSATCTNLFVIWRSIVCRKDYSSISDESTILNTADFYIFFFLLLLSCFIVWFQFFDWELEVCGWPNLVAWKTHPHKLICDY